MHLRAPIGAEHAGIRELLVESGLPTDDLDSAAIEFILAFDDLGMFGVVGLESFEDTGLLRSLAVRSQHRGSGTGGMLVDALESLARDRGLRCLVLLTQTAAPFFAKRGYRFIAREMAPDPVRQSAEFRSICPASATCMMKPLAPSAERAAMLPNCSMTAMATRKRILFVCVENSNRSQMAEAFARIHGGDGVEASSAGSKPSGRINPKAIRFMAELGYDLGVHASRSLDDIDGEFDAVITMGCGDNCPWVPAKRREDWGLPDPRDMDDDGYRAVRDEIATRVKALLAEL